MSGRVIDVPAEVRGKALAVGDRGRRWLEDLADVVAGLERDWNVVVGATLRGGSDAFVAEAVTADGRATVLKVALPWNAASHQIDTLLRAGGRGYTLLLRHDVGRQAMLQERLGAPLATLGLPVAVQLQVICATLQQAWAVEPDPSFRSGADHVAWLADFIAATWRQLGSPCPERVVDLALSFAEERRRAFDPGAAVLVHGDAHAWNTLLDLERPESGAPRFKLIDPDGLFAEPACDLAVPMREFSDELLAAPDPLRAAKERCAFLSHLTGVDPQAIWAWGYIERVSTGLLAMRAGLEQIGADMLAVAAAIV